MLDIIRKAEYFDWLDNNLADARNYSLKGIQDGWIVSLLSEKSDLKIAEVGGGHSRVLQKLSPRNECWNIDKFEGQGQGPTEVVELANVKIVRAFLGDFDTAIPDQYFDVVFSVSVVEHVPGERLNAFFADCHRILKPGGMMAHAIDLYISDSPETRLGVIDAYQTAIESQGFEWFAVPVVDGNVTFQSCFASNSDITMNHWNRLVPSLRSIRETAQSVSIKLLAFKKLESELAADSAILRVKQSDRSLQRNFSPTQIELPQPKPSANQAISSLALVQQEPAKLAKALIGRIGQYYSRWPVVLAVVALGLNIIAVWDEIPFGWVFISTGTSMLLFLIGHAASKADYVLAELEQLKARLSEDSFKKVKRN